MYNVIEYLKNNYLFVIVIILELFIIVYLLIVPSTKENHSINNDNSIIAYEGSINSNENDIELVTVDIKGAVKKQGIYKVDKASTIDDVIQKSGGLLKNATTIDINLSKQVYNEMVIYISTKSEYKRRNELIKCNIKDDTNSSEIASKDIIVSNYNNTTANKIVLPTIDNNTDQKTNDNVSGLININTANKEEMQKIPGVGEAKAQKIIDYRNENGLFKTKDEIMNVSGIGTSVYEKIKDYITI